MLAGKLISYAHNIKSRTETSYICCFPNITPGGANRTQYAGSGF